jgi:membrane dipeptidase
MRQLKLYHAWQQAGLVRLMPLRGRGDAVMETSEAMDEPLMLGVLMECADPIESPKDLEMWVEGGVVAIGLAWWRGSRYAGGNGTPGRGLSEAGRALVQCMDELGVVHDVSHLSQRATDEFFAMSSAVPMASHSNCRSLLDGKNERHLSDEAIGEIGRRGGMIGLNLVRNFIRCGLGAEERPSAAEAIDHLEHMCALMGRRTGVGLGSDMDGGITADDLPAGIDVPSDLRLLANELRQRGWSEAEIQGFAWGNWARFWSGG